MAEKNFPWFTKYDPKTPHHIEYPGVTIDWFLQAAAQRFPEKDCCIFLDHSLTYRRLNLLVERLATGLRRLGLKNGDRVAVILPNCPQFVMAFYAIAKAGGVVVAINPAYKEMELTFQLNNSGALFAIVLDSVYELINAIQTETLLESVVVTDLAEGIRLNEDRDLHRTDQKPVREGDIRLAELLAGSDRGTDFPPLAIDAPVIFQYSGGTTGIPKAAIGSHRNLVANTLQFRAWLGAMNAGEEVVLAAIPLFHVYGMVIAMSLGIALGATLVLMPDPRDMAGILTAIGRYKATMFPGVPAMYQAIIHHADVKAEKYELRTIKACISGAAPLSPDVKRAFEAISGGKLLEGYGLSEAPTATHCNPLLGENRTGSIGLPLPDVEAKIVDIEDGVTVMPPGASGELIIRSPQVMMGYHNNLEETALALRNGWLFTGDIAAMDEDGYFYLVGRKKELIKIGGFQVWPREIEEVIAMHPAVMEVAVAGVEGGDRVEMVKAWIVVKPGKTVQSEEIRLWCEERIARYKVPAEVEMIDRIPKTTVGKVLKRELVRMDKINRAAE